MLCPHCRQEHPDTERVCPNTGLTLGQPVLCAQCGQAARPGARYCAYCGQALPRPQPPTTVNSDDIVTVDLGEPALTGTATDPAAMARLAAPPAEDLPILPPENQRLTRPSISVVELSRRETRRARFDSPTLQRAKQQWANQSRLWHLIGYTLLALVLFAGAAGLFLLWGQLRP